MILPITVQGEPSPGALSCVRVLLARLPRLQEPLIVVDARRAGGFKLDLVDELAYLQLNARRMGGRLEILVSGDELPRLVALVGLASVLRCGTTDLRAEGCG